MDLEALWILTHCYAPKSHALMNLVKLKIVGSKNLRWRKLRHIKSLLLSSQHCILSLLPIFDTTPSPIYQDSIEEVHLKWNHS